MDSLSGVVWCTGMERRSHTVWGTWGDCLSIVDSSSLVWIKMRGGGEHGRRRQGYTLELGRKKERERNGSALG